MLNWLLIFVPITIGLEFFKPEAHTYIFLAACLSIVPLAGLLGHATEQVSHHAGQGSVVYSMPPSEMQPN